MLNDLIFGSEATLENLCKLHDVLGIAFIIENGAVKKVVVEK